MTESEFISKIGAHAIKSRELAEGNGNTTYKEEWLK
jgi:hypothetical protein